MEAWSKKVIVEARVIGDVGRRSAGVSVLPPKNVVNHLNIQLERIEKAYFTQFGGSSTQRL